MAPEDEQQELALRPRNLAKKLIDTNKIVQEKVKEQAALKNQQSLSEILEMPLQQAYEKLLADLRFEYMDMKNSSGLYNHAYVAELPKGLNPPISKLVRLA